MSMIHDDVDHPVSGSVGTGSPLSIQSDMGIPHVYMSLPFYAEAAFFGIHADGNSPSPPCGLSMLNTVYVQPRLGRATTKPHAEQTANRPP